MRNRFGSGKRGTRLDFSRPRKRAAGPGRALSVLMLAALMSSTAIAPVSAQSYSFSQLRVEGNDRIDAGSILSYSGINRGQSISAGGLNDAYQRILASGLFESVEIVPQGGTLVIRVRELPTINVVDFEGNQRINDEMLGSVIQSQSRRVFSPQQVEADAAAIAEAYANSGRVAARVEPRVIRRDGNRVDVVFEIAEGRITEIERLSFTGNSAFSDRRLREVLQTKQAGLLRTFIQRDTYAAERVELDKQLLRDFYQSRGYVDFQVLGVATELTRDRDGFFLTYSLREGQQFHFGKISTRSEVQGLEVADFADAIRVSEGDTYSPQALERSVSRMERVILEKGLDFIRVEPRVTRNDRDQSLDIEFVVARGERIFVERIDIEGNATTLDKVVRRQFRSVEGDPFNPREIREAAERIRALGFFENADVQTRQGTAADQVVVDVNVEEKPTGSLSFGISYGVDQGMGFAISFSESNFLGRGQYFGASINTTSSSGVSQITFVEPYLFDRDLQGRFNMFYRTYDNDNADYSMKLIALNPSIEFPVSESMRLNLGVRLGSEQLYDVDRDSSSKILVEEEGRESSIGLSYTLSYDSRRITQTEPTSVRLSFGQEFYGLGGDVEAIKTTALAGVETRAFFSEDLTLRAEIEGGVYTTLGGTSSRVTNRFFGNQMRGFESRGIGPRDVSAPNEDPLGGNLYAIARLEAEFPLGLPEEYGIRGGLFWDVGTVWGLDNTAGGLQSGCTASGGDCTVDDSMQIRSAVGFSVFWTTPIGPLRFNFSKALAKEDYDKEQNFDFTVSTRF